MDDPVAIAVLAKAPVAGEAKTRLIPALGADGAAALSVRLIARAVATACGSGLGPVTLWATPDETHPLFQKLRGQFDIALKRQPAGDLGARMHTAIAMANGPVLVIGTDCPPLTPNHLRAAADALRECDAVVTPAEDGGYVLIGSQRPHAALFAKMEWGAGNVLAETRRRMRKLGLSWRELETLWDVDRPEDLYRMRREGMMD